MPNGFSKWCASPAGRPTRQVTPAEARALFRAGRDVLSPEPAPVAEIRDLAAPGPDGGMIPLRLYRGAGTAADAVLPALVYFHGGGWVVGDLDSYDRLCRHLANAAQLCGRRGRLPAGARAQIPGGRRGLSRRHPMGRRNGRRDSASTATGSPSAATAPAATLRRWSVCRRAIAARRVCARSCCSTRRSISRMNHASTPAFCRRPSIDPGDDAVVCRALSARDRGHRRLARLAVARPRSFAVAPAYVLTAGYDPLCDEGMAYAGRLRGRRGRGASSGTFPTRSTAF